MSAIVVSRQIACRSDVCSLWNVLTDTERMNRAVGLEKVAFKPLSDGTAARFLGTTNLGGFDVEYEERPYEWDYLRSFKVERRMRSGPAQALVMEFSFAVAPDGGTVVTLTLTLTPRIGLLRPIMALRGGQTLRQFERQILAIDAALRGGAGVPAPPPRGAVDHDAVERAAAELRRTCDGALVERLAALVRTGADADVSRIRPYALADEWRVDRRDLLATMLRGVRAGLFELRWELVCPSCRVATDAVPTLASLAEHGACQLCEIEFGLDVDEAVEATFAPTKAVREVDGGPYCIGGPARVPHVLAQAVLPAGATAHLVAPEEPGVYRLFVRGGATVPLRVAPEAPEVCELVATSTAEASVEIAPRGRVSVANPAREERHAKIERSSLAGNAATAREVTALPAFRRDFSSDTLRPGASLKVSRVGLFFSDLTASTQLYSDVGDAAAFRLVQDHFEVVLACLERHHGTLVKTIGDAVMAVFANDLDGVTASMDILREFEQFRAAHPHRARTHIKLGLHSGSCYVVTANGLLDYFGQSVNIAARLQAQADSGELVTSAELADAALARGLVRPGDVRERYAATLKGVTGPFAAVRIAAARAPFGAPREE